MDQQPELATPTPVGDRVHRVHWFAGRLGEVLDDLLGVDGGTLLALGLLDADQTAEVVVELARARARMDGLLAELLVHAETVEVGAHGAGGVPVSTSAAGWFAAATRTPRPVAHRTVKHAHRLGQSYLSTGAALRAGACDAAQAEVIVKVVDALPEEVAPAIRFEAEAHLLELARTYDASELKNLAAHLHEVIDPDGAEAALAARLAAEEEAAHAAATLKVWDTGKGRTKGTFDIPALHGSELVAVLDAMASPTRPANRSATDQPDPAPGLASGWVPDPTRQGRQVPRDQLRGRAFVELLERLPAPVLPHSGGSPFTVVVTMTLETLLGGLAPAVLDTGQPISPGEARRLAARHGVIPAVLGTDSEVLDLGRTARFHSTAQRVALRVQHRTCTAESCTIPAAWCHAHHTTPWARDGHTTLRDGTLLCGRHHRLVHSGRYTVTHDAAGTTHLTRIRR